MPSPGGFPHYSRTQKKLSGLKIVFSGDGNNNVTHSLALLSEKVGANFFCAAPRGYLMNKDIVKQLKNQNIQTTNPQSALKNADVIITDTWISMGAEKEKQKRLKIFPPYQINKQLLKLAKKDAIFMHCLPAYKNYEVTSEVIDGPQSIVYDEAENRLHVQKALILHLLGIKY